MQFVFYLVGQLLRLFFPCVCRWKETLNLAEILHEYVIIRRFTKPKNRVPVYFYRHFHPFWVARISCGKAYLLFWLLLCCVFTYKDMSLLGCLTLFAIVHVDMTTKTLCTNNISLSLSLVPYLSLNSIEKESHCIRLNCCLNVCSLLERINSSKKIKYNNNETKNPVNEIKKKSTRKKRFHKVMRLLFGIQFR